MEQIMSCRKDLTQWPRRRRKLLVLRFRVNLISQHPGDNMRSGRHSVGEHRFHRVQQELLRGIRAQCVHAHRRGQHAARMEEEVQMGGAV